MTGSQAENMKERTKIEVQKKTLLFYWIIKIITKLLTSEWKEVEIDCSWTIHVQNPSRIYCNSIFSM